MKNRIMWIDYMKAISIIMVVLCHIPCCPDYIRNFCAPFFLTTFLFSFGYTFNNKYSLITFIKKKVNTLLIPFFLLSLILVLSRYIISFSEHSELWKDLKNMLFQIRGNGDDLWFIALVFVSSLVFYFISKLASKKPIYIISLIVLFAFSYSYYLLGFRPLPWHLHIVGSAVFYIGVGYYCSHYNLIKEEIFKKPLFLASSILLYSIMLILSLKYFNNVSFSFYSYGNNIILYFIITILGLIFNISLSMNIRFDLLAFYGQNTLLIFGLHGKLYKLYYELFSRFFGYIKVNYLWGDGILLTILILLCTIATLIPIIKIVNKYLPVLSGKKDILKV